MTKIWDCFLFNFELDVLECRLETLAPLVDRFVIIEAKHTLIGNPKPSHYLDSASRFAPWRDKIVHVLADDLLWYSTERREARQRQWAREGLSGAAPDDVVMLSDVDEIPNPASLPALRNGLDRFVMFPQRFCCFAVDWVYSYDNHWYGTTANRSGSIASFAAMRGRRAGYERIEGPPGWHLSWIGGAPAGLQKIQSFPHAHLVDVFSPGVASERCYREGVYMDGTKLTPIDVDETWPAYIRERRCPANWFRPRP